MIYQLPNGKSIQLSLDEYLTLTDDEIQFLVAYGYGKDLNNPRHGSILGKLSKEDVDIEEEFNEEDEDELQELDNTPDYDKEQDMDIDDRDSD